MRGVWAYQEQNITINNLGIMKTAVGSYQNYQSNKSAHFMFEHGNASLTIENFVIPISESQSEFNDFKTYNDRTNNKNSHLIVWEHGNTLKFVAFKDKDSKLILDFESGFELGKAYKINKLVTNQNGDPSANFHIDFSRLTTRSSLYKLTQSRDYFIVSLDAPNSEIGILHKANIRTMNNFYTMSNSMIYPRKRNLVILRERSDRRISNSISSLRANPQDLRGNPLALSSLRASVSERGNPPYENNVNSALDSAFSLKSYESFAYQNESQNLQTRRIQRQNKRNYSRNVKDSSLRASVRERGNLPIKESLDSAFSLKSYESFAYQNESQNLQTRRIQRQNKRNYSRNLKDSSLRADSQNLRGNLPQNLNKSAESKPYYFILTPFVNHNYFFESGRYNLSGFDYGFLTAFSGKLNQNNSLGAHFMMSYGTLGDSSDKNFRISNLNLNPGLNYKLDLIWDMYLKARGDFFYFLNQVKTLTMINAIKPNNLGFGASVSYGKDFDFKQGGVLGIEGGLDYKALKSNHIQVDSQSYQQAIYNLIYADVGLNYQKYFGGFGINLGGGFKANLAPNLAKVILLAHSQNRSFVLDNDKYLGYANVALSYVLNHKNFDMEFSLAYYGNYGDRVVSNGGGVEWRVGW